MAKPKKPMKIYQVSCFSPETDQVGYVVFEKRPAALRYIKEQFWDQLDTGDRLRRIKPNIYVHEEDYECTGERDTADNYKHMYYWTLDEISVD